MPQELTVFLILTFAMFVQGMAGFGSALTGMPLLVSALSLPVASPLFAIVAGLGEIALIVRYWQDLSLANVWRLSLGAICGIPIGITLISAIPEAVMRMFLGFVVLGYAFYALFAPQLPRLHRNWGFGFGFVSGMLSGAYNTGGPPFVMYGTSQAWSPNEFKGNLQTAFVVSTITVLVGHTLAGRITGEVLRLSLFGIPAIFLGLTISAYFERFITPSLFRRGVLFLLIVIGLSLIF